VRKEKREFVDWYSAKPFEIVRIDLKYIRDHKALNREQMIHLDQYDIPNFKCPSPGRMDVNSRFKLIAYSREKSWTNGLCWSFSGRMGYLLAEITWGEIHHCLHRR
jgi:hypothetical protein